MKERERNWKEGASYYEHRAEDIRDAGPRMTLAFITIIAFGYLTGGLRLLAYLLLGRRVQHPQAVGLEETPVPAFLHAADWATAVIALGAVVMCLREGMVFVNRGAASWRFAGMVLLITTAIVIVWGLITVPRLMSIGEAVPAPYRAAAGSSE
jgi:hypothetical protein